MYSSAGTKRDEPSAIDIWTPADVIFVVPVAPWRDIVIRSTFCQAAFPNITADRSTLDKFISEVLIPVALKGQPVALGNPGLDDDASMNTGVSELDVASSIVLKPIVCKKAQFPPGSSWASYSQKLL